MPRFFLLSFLCALAAGCAPDAPPVSDPPTDARLVTTTDSLDGATVLIKRSDASFPTIAAAPTSGDAVVAWTEPVDGRTAVLVARWDEQGLTEPVRVSPASDDVAAHGQAPAQVAVGPGGQVVVVYVAQTTAEGRRFPASDLRLVRSGDGGRSFSPPVTVNEDEGFLTGHHFHDLAVGPDGSVYVSWLDSREQDRPRHTAHHGAASPIRLAHSSHVHEAGTEVRVTRSSDGGRTFAPSVVVAEGSCPCCRTSLALGPDGSVYVAWRHVFDEDIRDIALARSSDGGRTFAAPVRVHADGWHIAGCPHVGPAVAVDDNGRVHVVWYTGAADRAGVHYTASDDGETFEPAQTLSEEVPIAQVRARSNGGGVWIAWEEPVEARVRIAHVAPGTDAPAERALLPEQDTPALALTNGRWLLASPHPDGIALHTGDVHAR